MLFRDGCGGQFGCGTPGVAEGRRRVRGGESEWAAEAERAYQELDGSCNFGGKIQGGQAVGVLDNKEGECWQSSAYRGICERGQKDTCPR